MVSPVKVLFECGKLSHSKQNSIDIENINIETIDGINSNHGNDDQISPLSVEMTTPPSIQEATTRHGEAATAPLAQFFFPQQNTTCDAICRQSN
jgi:hypothetical protein